MKTIAVILLGLTALSVGAVEKITLAEAARRAVARSPGLRAAESAVDEARRGQSEASATHYPRLDAGSAFTRGDGPVYAFASLLDQRNFTQSNFDVETLNHPGYVNNIKSYVRAGIPIFVGYDIQSFEKMAGLGVAQAERMSAGAGQAVRLAVLEVGIQTLRAKALSLLLAVRIRDSIQDIQSAQRLRGKGLVLGSDYFAAEAVLSGLKAWRVQNDKMAEAGQESLAVVLGLDSQEFELVGTLQRTGPTLPSLKDLIGLARVNRADVQSSALSAERAEVAAFKEKSAILPRIDAMAQAETNTEDFSSNPSNRLLMLRAEWALGDPAYGARRKKAEDVSRAERQRQAATEERARIEIIQSLRQFEGVSSALPLLDETVDNAKQSLDLFRPLYREGRQSILDVLRAEEALARAESARVDALAQFHLLRARTLAAAGILDEGAVGALSAAVQP